MSVIFSTIVRGNVATHGITLERYEKRRTAQCYYGMIHVENITAL